MTNSGIEPLADLARRAAPESLQIDNAGARFEPAKGEAVSGAARVDVSRASITIRFAAKDSFEVASAAYGEANGGIAAANGDWLAPRLNDAGATGTGERLFGVRDLVITGAVGEKTAFTRLVFAGAAFDGEAVFDNRRVVFRSLSRETASHHDERLSVAIEGDCDASTIEIIDRATSFVAGIDLELLLVESFSASGALIRARHARGFRRMGRGPHSPFAGVAGEHRTRAWACVAATLSCASETSAPVSTMINYMGSHSAVAELNSSAPLVVAAIMSAAHHRAHGLAVGAGTTTRAPELALLDRELALGLVGADIERFERLRVEIMEAGFFHAPGYETGRPQRDIKFLRDLAHLIVLRLCGYSGPFYGAENFRPRET